MLWKLKKKSREGDKRFLILPRLSPRKISLIPQEKEKNGLNLSAVHIWESFETFHKAYHMFLDGLNSAKGSAVRDLKKSSFFARRGKNENEKIKAGNGFPLLQVWLGRGGWVWRCHGSVRRQGCMSFECVCGSCCFLTSVHSSKGEWLTISMRLIRSHLSFLSFFLAHFIFLYFTAQHHKIEQSETWLFSTLVHADLDTKGALSYWQRSCVWALEWGDFSNASAKLTRDHVIYQSNMSFCLHFLQSIYI